MVEGYLWMLNVVELSQIGDLADLVVDLELPGLVAKKLIRGILGGSCLSLQNISHGRARYLYVYLYP